MLPRLPFVGRIVTQVQEAAVNLRVQRLDAPAQHLGEAGEIGHLRHGQAGVAQAFGSAAGGEEFDAELFHECTGERFEAGFVG